MDDSKTVENLGTPLGADLGAIERELTEFWSKASQQMGETAAIRACSCNLIILVSGQKEAEALPPIIADVAEWHPCRSLVAFREEENIPGNLPPMQGWIHVRCKSQLGGGPQVCSEMITIGVRRDAVAGLAHILISLLVPDLPVFLYWRHPRAADWTAMEALSRLSGLLILDSQTLHIDPQDREHVFGLLTGTPRGVEIRDLSWARLTAWRDLIAQFFDTQASRTLLKELAEVEIHRVPASRDSIPALGLLLAGWMASRLNWRIASAHKEEGEWRARMLGPDGEVVIRFISAPADSPEVGIEAVTLKTRGGATFSVTEDKERACMKATTSGPGTKPMVHTVPCQSTSEANLLIGELSLPDEDIGFQAALAAAREIESSFR
jgi:glucose-6-phosphate dehydrogenase assembly protein OpcA